MTVRKLAFVMSSYLARELKNPASQPVLDYGLQVIIGALFKVTTILLTAWVLGILVPTLWVMTSAAVLRLLSGGPHCSSYERCLLSTLLIFLPLGWLSSILSQYISVSFQMLLWSSAAIILFLIMSVWAPGEHEERILTPRRKELSKTLSSMLIAILWCAAITTMYLGVASQVWFSVLLGLMWQSFSITPLGYLTINKLDSLLSYLTPKEVTPEC